VESTGGGQHHHAGPELPGLGLPPQQFCQPADVHARLAALKRRLAPQIAAFEKALNQTLYGDASNRPAKLEASGDSCLVEECA
jgi:hypothetical protein